MVTILLIAGLAVILVVSGGLALRIRQEAALDEGQRLQRRFGPEYDRVLARHHGDTKRTSRELRARLKKYGTLQVLPLGRETRELCLARWNTVEETFADSPRQALEEAADLLTALAAARGYPMTAPLEERIAALSVHHARRVHGYRCVHEAGPAQHGTEADDMRTALLEARALFDALLHARPHPCPLPPQRPAGAVRPRVG
ncbi:hypothetical protein [Streptomyces sp. enrichment culture]|uniref:hypothetical protein n=1 Tax=Streptomyces sp. enrichment culture TaxID=1795815 RepID=UPI003F564407